MEGKWSWKGSGHGRGVVMEGSGHGGGVVTKGSGHGGGVVMEGVGEGKMNEGGLIQDTEIWCNYVNTAEYFKPQKTSVGTEMVTKLKWRCINEH